jgi:hypothetical protein
MFIAGVQKMTSSTLRSTGTISEYLTTVDALAAAAEALKTLQRREKELRPDVLSQIGLRRAVMYCDAVRVLTAGEKITYSLVVDESQAVEYCRQHGIPIDERSPEYLSGAKRTKYGKEGILPVDILEPAAERIVIVG